MRGEWIEIDQVQYMLDHRMRLSPCGESGLKSAVNTAYNIVIGVSPHAGRVD